MTPKWLDRLIGSNAEESRAGVEAFKQRFSGFFDDQAPEQEEADDLALPPENDPQQPGLLPYLPLKNLVLMPQMTVPVVVGRPDSVRAVEEVLQLDDPQIVALAQRQTELNFLRPERDLYSIGTLATIEQHMTLPDGSIRLLLSGEERVRIEGFERDEHELPLAVFDLLPDDPVTDPIALEAAKRFLTTQLTLFMQQQQHIPDELVALLDNIQDISDYSYLVTLLLPDNHALRQEILSTTDVVERLQLLATLLAKELQIATVNQEIRSKASEHLKQAEKEYLLKEQLKVIKQELKETGGADSENDLLVKLEQRQLPEEVANVLKEEIERLETLPGYSPEAGLIRGYVDFALALPWHERTEESFDLPIVEAKLDHDHFGLDKVKERILEHLAVRKISPTSRNPILCFVGPPGTGKTSLAKSVAEALDRKFVRISLGGVRDEAEIRGHRRTYVGALPGRIIKAMKTAGVVNPVLLLDEVDKMDSDLRGDPTAALLEVLDPEQNNAFADHYLEVPYDLSQVMFITTANMLYTIPEPLQDRLEIIQLSSYTDEEKLEICKRHLLPRQIKEHGLEEIRKPLLSDGTIRQLIEDYTREAGVRHLERQVAKICRKIAKGIVEETGPLAKTRRISPSQLKDYLGAPKFLREAQDKDDQIGIATGLAWTEVGGETLPIEVAIMPGKGELTITGQLGDVMQESAKAALSYIRARDKAFKLPKELLSKYDLHIHVPEGAVPKDGPSAGIAIASALVSALTKRPVAANVAMTGEITLRGRVLPIGGIKEKLLAAHRAGLKQVIIPERNQADLEDVPEQVRKALRIIAVSDMDQVIENAIRPAKA